MMVPVVPPDHGRRLSQAEYEHAVVALYDGGAQDHVGSPDDVARMRAELNLAIDYRLGVDFPALRREALWRIQQRIEQKRLRLLANSILARVFPWWRHVRVNGLIGYMMREYEQVLNPAELRAFLPSAFEDETDSGSTR